MKQDTVMPTHDMVAFALFALYVGSLTDDQTSTIRIWANMDEQKRSLWHRRADVALAAA